ncbi:UNVERIFIED_CONTAM: hypothetical protein HDU68_011194 [Siphonaria sp. JEL0065]|nr:hypothetical protein HDU68_011194 [Siphonaria sp. JEL0065]
MSNRHIGTASSPSAPVTPPATGSNSASTSTPASPRQTRAAPFGEIRKRLSAPFQSQQQRTVATRVPDALNFFFPPQVAADPSADIDALTVIGGRTAGMPHHIERWLIAKEKAADVHVEEGNYDVDNMMEIGDQFARRKKKGFDVGDMMGVGSDTGDGGGNGENLATSRIGILGGSTSVFTMGKRRSSFPPPGLVSKDLTNLLTHRQHNHSKMTIHMVPVHGGASGVIGPEDDDDERPGYLVAADSTRDIDELMDSDPAAEAVIRGIDNERQRERVKEVLQDVQDHISHPIVVKRQSIHPKVDVDQMISKGEYEAVAEEAKSPRTLKSRANSIFKSTKSLHKQSTPNLNKPKISSATTEDVDEMNAVYYPWTTEGTAAKDLSTLLEFVDKLQKDRQLLHEPVPVKQVSRQDIDTVVLVGSQENLAIPPGLARSIPSHKASGASAPTNTPNAENIENLRNFAKSGATIPSIHKSAPQIHKMVDFILPEKSGPLFSYSDASIPTSLASTNSGHPKQKRDIDFFFGMADEAPVKKHDVVVDDKNKKRDFTEIVNMADSVLELNEKGARARERKGRSKSITVMTPTLQRLSVRLSVGRPSGNESGRESTSIREIANRSVVRAFSDNSVYVLDRERITFEPSKNAAFVKDITVPVMDVDALFGVAA